MRGEEVTREGKGAYHHGLGLLYQGRPSLLSRGVSSSTIVTSVRSWWCTMSCSIPVASSLTEPSGLRRAPGVVGAVLGVRDIGKRVRDIVSNRQPRGLRIRSVEGGGERQGR